MAGFEGIFFPAFLKKKNRTLVNNFIRKVQTQEYLSLHFSDEVIDQKSKFFFLKEGKKNAYKTHHK